MTNSLKASINCLRSTANIETHTSTKSKRPLAGKDMEASQPNFINHIKMEMMSMSELQIVRPIQRFTIQKFLNFTLDNQATKST